MLKRILFATTLSSALFLAGCSSIPGPKKTVTKCTVNNQGETECYIEITWEKNSGNFNNMQDLIYEDIAIDFSNSQRPLKDRPFGSVPMDDGIVKLQQGNSILAVKASSYSKQGQKITAADDQGMGNWMANYNGQANTIVLRVSNLKFDTVIGPNTITAEVTHNGNVLSGASTSFYKSESDSIGNN